MVNYTHAHARAHKLTNTTNITSHIAEGVRVYDSFLTPLNLNKAFKFILHIL